MLASAAASATPWSPSTTAPPTGPASCWAAPRREVCSATRARESYEGWDDAATASACSTPPGSSSPTGSSPSTPTSASTRTTPPRCANSSRPTPYPRAPTGWSTSASGPSDRYDPRSTWVYRVFAWRPGSAPPEQRLHFNPVPPTCRAQRGSGRPSGCNTSAPAQRSSWSSACRSTARPTPAAVADGLRGLSTRPRGDLPSGSAAARPARARGGPGGRSGPLVCLLPARNAEGDLPGWLESARGFADAVVALDDGSTDRTRELLAADRWWRCCWRTRRRESYEGWDDAANRQRLLDAAAELEPGWILSLDADERIDAADAEALRDFVEPGARPDWPTASASTGWPTISPTSTGRPVGVPPVRLRARTALPRGPPALRAGPDGDRQAPVPQHDPPDPASRRPDGGAAGGTVRRSTPRPTPATSFRPTTRTSLSAAQSMNRWEPRPSRAGGRCRERAHRWTSTAPRSRRS